MSALALLDTETERDLRVTVRALLAERCDHASVLAAHDGDRAPGQRLWRSLAADMGLAALMIPESRNGAGASAREASVVLEELGRVVAPVPFFTSAVLAATVLLDSDSALLELLASGESTAALAVPFSTSPGSNFPVLRLDEEWRLFGTVTSVAGALEADVLLVPVMLDGDVAVFAVKADQATVTAVVSLDMTRQLADISFHGVVGDLVTRNGEAAVRRSLATGAALLASEQVGLAQWCLDATVGYLKERRQFARVLGSFQALKHRLADLFTEVESAAAAAHYAAAAIAADDADAATAVAVAQAFCSDVAVKAAEEAVQLHGGIGMTWEHPVHLYLKRAKANQIALGTPGAHRAQLATLLELPMSLAR